MKVAYPESRGLVVSFSAENIFYARKPLPIGTKILSEHITGLNSVLSHEAMSLVPKRNILFNSHIIASVDNITALVGRSNDVLANDGARDIGT